MDRNVDKSSEPQEDTPQKYPVHVRHKFLHDRNYRERVLLTLCLYVAFAVLGGTKGQLGPALLDLRLICNVDLEKGALIVTCLYIGLTVGSMLSGVLYHKVNRIIMFSLCSFGMAVTSIVIPWCSMFPLMLAVHVLLGILQGITDTAGNTEVIRSWKKDSRTLVVGLHLLFNLGGVISPIIISPFLVNVKDFKTNNVNVSEENLYPFNFSIFQNESIRTHHELYPKSRIHFGYVMSSIVCVLVAILFLILFCFQRYDFRNKNDGGNAKGKNYNLKSDTKTKSDVNLSKLFRILVLFVMVSIATLSRMIDNAFVAFLSTFCINALDWTPQEGSFVTSLYFVFVVIGNLFGTVLTKVISTVTYNGIQIGLMFLSFVCLLVSVKFSFTIAIWICASIFGYAKSVIFPLTLIWTNDTFMTLSGKTTSVFFTSTMIGSTTNPLLLASIMTAFTPMWFCYLFVIESGLLVGFYISAVVMTRFVDKLRNIITNADTTELSQVLD